MVKKTGVGVLFSLVLVLFAYSSAVAQAPEFNFKKDNVYVSINTGVTLLNNIGFGTDLNYGGVLTADVSGEVSFDTGASVGGAIGYILNNHVRTEFELGYTEMDHAEAKLSAAWTYTSGGTTLTGTKDAEVAVDGKVETLYGVANIIFTPFASTTAEYPTLTPLIGGGIGFADWDSEIKSLTSAGTTLPVNGKDSDTDFLATIIAGLEYNHDKNISFNIKYRHAWVNSGKNGLDDAEADNVVGSFRYRF